MVQGSTLNFNRESAAFAKALQAEHSALGDLLADIEVTVAAGSAPGLSTDLVKRAKATHDAVKFQRTRTEAARGRR